MKTTTYFGYDTSRLKFDGNGTGLVLTAGSASISQRLRFELWFEDKTGCLCAHDCQRCDFPRVEGRVLTLAGTLVAQGMLDVRSISLICPITQEAQGLFEMTVADRVLGYIPALPLIPDLPYRFARADAVDDHPSGSVPLQDQREVLGQVAAKNDWYHEAGQSPINCFGPGTMIMTDQGEIPVEWLDTTDKVLTRDHGFQPVRWIGRTRLSPAYFRHHASDSPIRIPAGSMGNGAPTHDLHITGNHKLLLRTQRAEAVHGSTEVLIPADALADLGRAEAYAPANTYTITHVLCADHELLLAQGLWVESMFPFQQTIERMSPANRTEFEALLARSLCDMEPVRPRVSRKEAHGLIEASRSGQTGHMPDTVRKRA